jgi:hypothetical protein
MSGPPEAIDISGLPEVARLAEEVRRSRTPRELRRGSEVIARIVPATPLRATVPARRGGRTAEANAGGASPSATSVVAATAGIFKGTAPPLSAEELRVAAEEAIAEDVEERSR